MVVHYPSLEPASEGVEVAAKMDVRNSVVEPDIRKKEKRRKMKSWSNLEVATHRMAHSTPMYMYMYDSLFHHKSIAR